MAFPIIRPGATSAPVYPFKRILRTRTKVMQFENGTSQRFIVSPPTVDFDLPFGILNATDANTIRSAHTSAKGQLDNTLSLTHNGVVYTGLAFVDDYFTAVEYQPTVYRAAVKLRQTVPQLLTMFANGNVYPPGLTGGDVQLPYSRGQRSKTYLNEMEPGQQYAYGLYGTGLTRFPAAAQKEWEIQYDMLSDVDLSTLLERFFLAQNGRWGRFSFTDPENSSVTVSAGFNQDDLEIESTQPDVNRVTVRIVDTLS